MMFDGAAGATAHHHGHHADAPHTDGAPAAGDLPASGQNVTNTGQPTQTNTGRPAEPDMSSQHQPGWSNPDWSNSAAGGSHAGHGGGQIAFVDNQIANYQAIVSAIDPSVKVVVFDGSKDGLSQIVTDLQGVHGLKSIDIIARGGLDTLTVGTDTLTTGSISQFSGELAAIGKALSHHGQLDLYGSEVSGASDAFLTGISAATGRDVAASTTPVGAAQLGGTWTLDVSTGAAPIALAADVSALQGFDGLLANPAGLHPGDQVVFVDSQIRDYQTIVDAINPGTKVFVFDGTQDGLAEIAKDLQGAYNLAAVDIISHGGVDSVQLGTDVLTADTIAAHSADLKAIGNALAANGQIDLYGCDVAAAGDGFLDALKTATGRDIAASTDITGPTALGGNWTLEATTGGAPVALAADLNALQSFNELLVSPAAPIHGTVAVGTLSNGSPSNFVQAGNGGNSTATATDSAGNIYVTGSYQGTDVFGTFAGGGTGSLTSPANAVLRSFVYVAKYNSSGVLQWVDGFGGSVADANQQYPDTARTIAVTPDGSKIYVGGQFAGTINFDGTHSATTATGQFGSYVVQLNGSGAVQWDAAITNSNANLNLSSGTVALAADSAGNVFVAAEYSLSGTSAPTLTSGTGVSTVLSNAGVYNSTVVYELSASGALQWRAFVTEASAGGGTRPTAIAIDSADNVYFSGQDYQSTLTDSAGHTASLRSATFSGVINGQTFNNLQNYGAYVAKLNSSGVFQWQQQLSSTSIGGSVGISAIAVDAFGPVIAGSYSDGATINGTLLHTTITRQYSYSYASSRAFVEQFDAAGTAKWAKFESDNGQASFDGATNIAIDAAGNIVVAGSLLEFSTNAINFDGKSLTPDATRVQETFVWDLTPSASSATTNFVGAFGSRDTTVKSETIGGLFATAGGGVSVAINFNGQIDADPGNPVSNLGTKNSGIASVSLIGLTGSDLNEVVAPVVNSITTVGATTNHNTTEQFNVTFSENVSGVDVSDFTLTKTGTAIGTISSVVQNSASSYTVNVTGVAGDGTLRLDLNASGTGIKSGAVDIASGFTGGGVYTIDQIPVVTNVALLANSTNNATSESIRFTFSKAVSGVVLSDFSLALSGVSATLQSVTGSGTTYTVTANNVTGNGTLGINLSNFAGIIDAAGTAVAAGANSALYTIDQAPPTVTSIATVGASPNNAASDQFTVNFSESVSGVDTSDFTLATTGGASATISSITGSGSTYTVTVTGVSGAGTLGLNLKSSGTGITDIATNVIAGGFTGQTYTVDRVSPTATVALVEAPTNNRTSEDFTVTFSEAVSIPTAADFSLTGTASAGASVSNIVSAGGNAYTVTVSGVTSEGTLNLQLKSGNTVTDTVGNLANPSNTVTYTIDHVAPIVSSINRLGVNPNNATSEQFIVTFSEAVSGVTFDDFTAIVGGTVADTGISVTGSGTTYTVTVNGVTGDGSFGLDLNASGTGITDIATNAVVGGFTGQTYAIDHTAPTTTVALVEAATNNRTSEDFTVTFSEAVSTPVASDFSLTGTASAGASVSNIVSAGGNAYTVTVSGVTSEGTLNLQLKSGNTVKDTAGNLANPSNTVTYTVDHIRPGATVALVEAATNNRTSEDFTVTFSEAVSTPVASDFSITGAASAGASVTNIVSAGGNAYTVTVSGVTGDGILTLQLKSGNAVTDSAGNLANPSNTAIYTVDQTAPIVTSITRVGSATNNASSEDFTVTFSESVTGVTADDFAAVIGGTVADTGISVTGSGTTYTVTVNGVTGDGTLGLNLNGAGTGIADTATNAIVGGFTGQTYTVDHTAPTVLSIARLGTNPNAATSDQFAVTFSENVTGVNAADFTAVTGGTVADTGITVTGSGANYVVTVNGVTGDGTIGLNLNAAGTGIVDAVTNAIAGGFTGETYTILHTPTITTLVGQPLNNDMVRLQGSGLTAGDIVTLFADGGLTPVGSGVVSAGGTFDITTTVAFADAVHSFTATETTGSGFTSAASPAFTVNVLPTAPVITALVGQPENGGTVELRGTGEVGQTINLFNGSNTVVGSGIVQADGTFDITTTATFADGIGHFTATETDAANLTSAASAAFTVNIIPNAPVITTLVGQPVNGGMVHLQGTGEAGETVQIFADGGNTVVGSGIVAANGRFDITTTAVFADAVHSFTATETDAANLTSNASAAFSVNVLPTAPVITALIGQPENGQPVHLQGTGEAGETVNLFADGGNIVVGTGIVAANGTFDITTTANFTDAVHSFTATETDAANLTSAASTAFSVDVIPNAPVITALVGQPENGQAVTVTGTGEVGETVTLFNNAAVVGSGVVGAGGTFTITTSQVFVDGNYSFTAKETNAANLTSLTSPAFSVDVLPNAPIITALVGQPENGQMVHLQGTGAAGETVQIFADGGNAVVGTGVVDGTGHFDITTTAQFADAVHSFTATQTDSTNLTSAASAAFSVNVIPNAPVITGVVGQPVNGGTVELTGTGEAGETVRIFADGGNTVVGSGIVAANGTFDITTTATFNDAAHSFTATETNAANLTSTVSNTLPVNVLPNAPIITTLVGQPENGQTVHLQGTGEAGETVQIFADGGNAVVGTGVVAANGTFDITTTTAFADAVHNFTATETNTVANLTSAASTAFPVNVIPNAPVITTLVGQPVNGGTVELRGTGEAGETVRLFADGGNTVVGTGIVAANGTFDITTTATFTDAVHSFTASQTDAANLTSAASNNFQVNVNPNAPVITTLVGQPVNGGTVELRGTGEVGETVRLFADGGNTVIGTGVVAANGTFDITTTVAFTDAVHRFTATETNAANLTSAVSAAFSVDVLPSAPVITGVVGQPTDGQTVTITGTGQPGDTVQIFADGGTTAVGTGTVGADGTFTVTTTVTFGGGEHRFAATQTDASNLTSVLDLNGSSRSTLTVTIDTRPALATSAALPAAPDGTTANVQGTQAPVVTNVQAPAGINFAPFIAVDLGTTQALHSDITVAMAADGSVNFNLPLGAVAASLGGEIVNVTASLADGSPLPPWLHADGNGRQAGPNELNFAGQVPDDIVTGAIAAGGGANSGAQTDDGATDTSAVNIRVVARGTNGREVIYTFTVKFTPQDKHTLLDRGLLPFFGGKPQAIASWAAELIGQGDMAHLRTALDRGLGDASHDGDAGHGTGRSGLSEQINTYGWRGMHVQRMALLDGLRQVAAANAGR